MSLISDQPDSRRVYVSWMRDDLQAALAWAEGAALEIHDSSELLTRDELLDWLRCIREVCFATV